MKKEKKKCTEANVLARPAVADTHEICFTSLRRSKKLVSQTLLEHDIKSYISEVPIKVRIN